MIRPIEMQMLLPRTESVGTEKHFENKQIVNENNFAANEVQKEVKHNSETVIQKDANQFAEYQYDAKEHKLSLCAPAKEMKQEQTMEQNRQPAFEEKSIDATKQPEQSHEPIKHSGRSH